MKQLSPRREYILNRFRSYGINAECAVMNKVIEIVISFHPTDEKIEAGLSRIKKAQLKSKIINLPGFVHSVFKDQNIHLGK